MYSSKKLHITLFMLYFSNVLFYDIENILYQIYSSKKLLITLFMLYFSNVLFYHIDNIFILNLLK